MVLLCTKATSVASFVKVGLAHAHAVRFPTQLTRRATKGQAPWGIALATLSTCPQRMAIFRADLPRNATALLANDFIKTDCLRGAPHPAHAHTGWLAAQHTCRATKEQDPWGIALATLSTCSQRMAIFRTDLRCNATALLASDPPLDTQTWHTLNRTG